jgi:hypothetical protein
MRYKLAAPDPDKATLVLSMPERVFIAAFLSVAAAVCLLLGLAFAVSGDGPDDRLQALCFLGFGLFCFSATFLFLTQLRPPRRIVMDNGAGQLVIGDGQPAGAVPYAGIRGISVCPSVIQRIAGHSVGVDLARGGRIELYVTRSRDRAYAFRDAVAGRVRLTSAVAGASTRDAPAAQGAPSPRPGVFTFGWARKTRPASLAISIVVLLSFAAGLAGSRPFASGPGAWIAALAFGAFFLIAAAVGILRTLGERMSIHMDDRSLQFHRRSPLSRGSSFSLPLAQIAMVDFSMLLSRVATRITFLKADEVEKFGSYRQGTFPPAETVGMIGFLRGLPHIDVSALPPSRRFFLAETIRERLQQPG